ncbi:metallophosphoesterase family protein [Dictyobacter arantiisoli]|uniref:Phosphoesterase n=1 Tax=Dictyobacter arantiisoli TaxID=2014874 RepID=A0A5A5TB59_9CHLR|nr:metallophosphoesterase family protein [Dictyobacter arantiisoli]GCF08144.1 phosphoesterase [Dictyobacter arantiisoli]
MLHRIGVISDTHLPQFKQLPEALWTHFADVELIIHAGDLSQLSVLSELETLAPVVAVQGNVELPEVVMQLPIKKEITVGGCRIGIVHILGSAQAYPQTARREFPLARVVVFGHSHNPYNEEHAGQLLFNPGSATDRRHQPTCSLGMLTIDDQDGSVHGETIPLPR